jgi:hypothetical protein
MLSGSLALPDGPSSPLAGIESLDVDIKTLMGSRSSNSRLASLSRADPGEKSCDAKARRLKLAD